MRLDELLQDCTVKLTAPSHNNWGTGFFVAPGRIVTCAHVIRSLKTDTIHVNWHNQANFAIAQLEQSSEACDLALLRFTGVESSKHPSVSLDVEFQPDDDIYLYGYPNDYPDGASVTAKCEGHAELNGLAVLKFKFGQVRPGLSGSPVLNQRTGRVCGVVKSTRDRGSDLGGEAIQCQLLFKEFPDIAIWQQSVQQGNSAWGLALKTHLQEQSSKYLQQAGNVSQPLGRREYLKRQVLLNRVYNGWIRGFLEKSLFNEINLELGLEERSDLIEFVWETPERYRQTLKQGVKTIHKFDELGAGRTLLLLGAPGSGKTTTLLEMARDLIERAKQDEDLPIPIILNLSSWNKTKNKFVNWLIQELESHYNVKPNDSKERIQKEQFLLLLDGLDEVREELRDSCVDVINKFSQEYGQTEIVICSRIQEYKLLNQSLNFQGVLFIQPLKFEQVLNCLEQAGEEFTGIKAVLQTDSVIQELARTPLMLSVMTLAYEGMSASDFSTMTSKERQRHLWGKYIDRALIRRQDRSGYPRNMTLNWLGFLAQRLTQESQTLFLIEKINPSWLKTKLERRTYPILVGLITGLAIEWLYGLPIGLIAGVLSFHMLVGLLTGFTLGLLGSLGSEIQLFTAIGRSWSWEKAWKTLIPGLSSGPLIGALIWFLGKPLGIVTASFKYYLIISFITGLVVAIISMFFSGLVSSDLTGSLHPSNHGLVKPNQGIWQTFHRATTTSFIVTVTIILPIAIFLKLFIPLSALLACISLYAGGLTCIQHMVIRSLLTINGDTPWNYAKFLNNSSKQVFLKKTGSSYQFFHDLLRKEVADMFSQKIQKSTRRFSRLILIFSFLSLTFGLISLTFPIALNTWRVETIHPIFTSINQGDRLLVDRVGYHVWELQRGDIISFSPTDEMKEAGFNYTRYNRQILGLPGEEVKLIDDTIYIDNNPFVQEDLILHKGIQDFIREHDAISVPENKYLVIVRNPDYKDNNNPYYMDNLINLIPKRNIDSHVIFRFWPLRNIGKVNW